MKRFNLYLKDRQINKLQAMSEAGNTSMAQLVRQAVDFMLAVYEAPETEENEAAATVLYQSWKRYDREETKNEQK